MELNKVDLEAYLSHFMGQQVQIERLQQLGGANQDAAALKAFGYGQPLQIDCRIQGEQRRLVLRQVNRNGFGHERSADRIAEVWLNFNTFNCLAQHVKALDMVGATSQGELTSIGDLQDMLLLTDYAPGSPYAEDLLRIRDDGACLDLDIDRARTLATYLAEIHAVKHDDALLWRRRLRDLIGDGEGIMGLADSYPADFPLATGADLRAIEEAANGWRWKLKPLTHRLSQVHGDFHPFNLLFTKDGRLFLLDRSRGEWGEPADDVSCLTINFLFFSLQRHGQLDGHFAEIYTTFWQSYLSQSKDDELLAVIQPWFAWRALVLANPLWYPSIEMLVRHQLLTFARRVLNTEYFAWQKINQYLTA